MQALDDIKNPTTNLVQAAIHGDRRALAHLLTCVENDTLEGRSALSELYPLTGKAHLVGVTGSPGSGKSSLVNQIARHYRNPPDGALPRKVAVVAVDPSSPFSGGAVLGDRIRMRDLAGDAGVFIRSMASRGASGGLAHATARVVQVFDAAGYDVVMIETVGAGQSEVEIARLAHTVLVVDAPGMGDDIQAIKAGLLEVADILVVNKADRPGVEAAEHALRAMLEMHTESHPEGHDAPCDDLPHNALSPNQWVPPVVCTIATQGSGIDDLVRLIDAHRDYLLQGENWQQKHLAHLQVEMENLVKDGLFDRWRESLEDGIFQQILDEVGHHQLSPQQAAQKLISDFEIRNMGALNRENGSISVTPNSKSQPGNQESEIEKDGSGFFQEP